MTFDPNKAAALSRFKSPLADNWMLAEITNAEDGTSQAGREQIVVTLAPVANNVTQRDLTLRGYIAKPQDDDTPDTLSKIRRRGYGFVRAMNPDFPNYPRRLGKGVYEVGADIETLDPRTGETTKFAAGEQVDFKGYDAVCRAVDAAVFKSLIDMAEGADDLKGKRVFMRPQKAKVDDEGRVSQFIGQYRAELPDGETYLDDDLIDHDLEQELLSQLGLS